MFSYRIVLSCLSELVKLMKMVVWRPFEDYSVNNNQANSEVSISLNSSSPSLTNKKCYVLVFPTKEWLPLLILYDFVKLCYMENYFDHYFKQPLWSLYVALENNIVLAAQ